MESYLFKLIFSLVAILVLLVIRFAIKNVMRNVLDKFHFGYQRSQIALKIVNLFTLILVVGTVAAIWGVNESELVVYISSLLTILGIAFFAQWSLLSNITASLILFFNHPLKLGDYIRILDKDYPIEGIIEDITYFFVHIRLDTGEKITIPNSLMIQKTISLNFKRATD